MKIGDLISIEALRKILKDPKFRKIEVFPLAAMKDILA